MPRQTGDSDQRIAVKHADDEIARETRRDLGERHIGFILGRVTELLRLESKTLDAQTLERRRIGGFEVAKFHSRLTYSDSSARRRLPAAPT